MNYYSYDRRTAARKPARVWIIEYIKSKGGEAGFYDVVGIGGRGNGQVIKSLIHGGYLSKFEGKDEDGETVPMLRLEKEPEYLAKGGKISKSALEAWCKRNKYPLPAYEAYGRKVEAYWYKIPSGMDRRAFERELESVGGRITEWYPGRNDKAAISNVSFFKAPGWDE